VRAVRSLRSPDAQTAARFVRPLPQALGGYLDQKKLYTSEWKSSMSEVKEILEANTKFRIERDVPDLEEILELQKAIGTELPASYIEFLELRGLDDQRFNFEILDPSQIQNQLRYVASQGLVPFASNGSGDLVCWSLTELPCDSSYFWDHESDSSEKIFSSFEEALKSWRF
jgi:hypothetical protein